MPWPARRRSRSQSASLRRSAGSGARTAILRASPGPPTELRARTGPEELVGTDLPIVAYLADRRVPGQVVDTSFVRLATGSLTDAEILEELDGVRAVVVGREFASRPALVSELAERYPEQISEDGVTIYLAP